MDLLRLKSARLNGTPLSADDFEDLRSLHLDAEVMQTLGGLRSEKQTRSWLQENLGHWAKHGFGLWIFRRTDDQEFVGRCGLRRVNVDGSEEVELAYALVKEYWGKGLATEMARSVLNIGFDRFRLDSVIVLVDAANSRSRRLAEGLNFFFERETHWKALPALEYRLHRSRWV